MNENKSNNPNIQMLLERNSTEFQQNNPAPHCVNPDCRYFHQKNIHDSSWRNDHGYYDTRAFGRVKRYMCTCCGKTFSDQSFSLDYYVKKPVDYIQLIRDLVSTSGLGNLSRLEGVRYELIQNRYERLCRLFLAFHAELRKQITPDEDFVFDGFESFSRSQYYPNNINIIAGSESEFIYEMGFAQLRRKGAMTKKQKEKRRVLEEEYGKAPPKAVEMSAASMICDLGKLLHSNNLGRKTLNTDEHKAYPRAFKRIVDFKDHFRHVQFSSKKARTFDNPLFPVNYVDRQIRKDQANHVRETVQFARCPTAMMIRLGIYQIYHNYMMPRRVRAQRKGNWETRGEYLGLDKRKVLDALDEVWGKRVFFHKYDLWEEEKKTWLMQWRNSEIRMGRRIPDYIVA